jgi:hypothetical protein
MRTDKRSANRLDLMQAAWSAVVELAELPPYHNCRLPIERGNSSPLAKRENTNHWESVVVNGSGYAGIDVL